MHGRPVPGAALTAVRLRGTIAGAEWIDDLARRTKEITDRIDSQLRLVHADWRTDNLRVSDHGSAVTAIYDWDSLQLQSEPIALGVVAAMHTVDFMAPGGRHFPTADECLEFAAAAVAARRAPSAVCERRLAAPIVWDRVLDRSR